MIRQHLSVYGEVQGVGFRYRAFHTAVGLGLTGYVRNVMDGSVEMEVQGEREVVEQFLQQVGEGAYISISDINKKEIPVIEERSFLIRDRY